MRRGITRKRRRGSQAGVSMIELLIAGVVMVIGFLGLIVLLMTAIANNNRNKMDSTSALVAQMVVEEASRLAPNGSSTSTLRDCAGNDWTLAVAPGGATLSSSSIDFSASTVGNYNMQWVVCVGTVRTTYDVRWNVQQLTGNTSLITVGVRKAGASSALARFALPISVRTILGS